MFSLDPGYRLRYRARGAKAQKLSRRFYRSCMSRARENCGLCAPNPWSFSGEARKPTFGSFWIEKRVPGRQQEQEESQKNLPRTTYSRTNPLLHHGVFSRSDDNSLRLKLQKAHQDLRQMYSRQYLLPGNVSPLRDDLSGMLRSHRKKVNSFQWRTLGNALLPQRHRNCALFRDREG